MMEYVFNGPKMARNVSVYLYDPKWGAELRIQSKPNPKRRIVDRVTDEGVSKETKAKLEQFVKEGFATKETKKGGAEK